MNLIRLILVLALLAPACAVPADAGQEQEPLPGAMWNERVEVDATLSFEGQMRLTCDSFKAANRAAKGADFESADSEQSHSEMHIYMQFYLGVREMANIGEHFACRMVELLYPSDEDTDESNPNRSNKEDH